MNGSITTPARTGRESLLTWVVLGSAVFVGTFEAISVYSTLNGIRPTGAYQGLAVFLVLGFAASALMPSKAARRRVLARAAIAASLVALAGTLLIPARVADAQGSLPSGIVVAQTALLVLFQLGWAVTHWLTVERRTRGKARQMPAALGTVLLLGGGFMLGRMGDTALADGPLPEPSVVYERYPTDEELAFATETETAGETRGSEFAHYGAGGQPMLGLSFSTQEWFSRERIDSDLRGVFDRSDETEGAHVLIAPEGYVVAGIEAQADENVSALRVQFAPYDGTFVSPFDRYWSDWYGGYVRGERGILLEVPSTPVVGVRGSTGMVLNSLSLLATN